MIRRVVLLALVGLVVVVGGWFGLFWRSQSSHLRSLENQRSEALSNVNQLQGELAGLKALQLKTPAERAALSKLEEAVPEGPSLDQLLDSLNDAALSTGVTLSSISTPAPSGWAGTTTGTTSTASGPGPQSMSLSLAVNGSNYQVLRFVNALDSEKRLFVVDTFSLDGSSPATGRQTTTGSGSTAMTVQAFYISSAANDPASLFAAPGTQG